MIIRDFEGDAPPAITDPRWVDELTIDVTISYVDCAQDFEDFTDVDNFSFLSQTDGL